MCNGSRKCNDGEEEEEEEEEEEGDGGGGDFARRILETRRRTEGISAESKPRPPPSDLRRQARLRDAIRER